MIDALLLGILYLGLAALLHLGALRLMRAGAFPGLIASFMVGSAVVWHSHEQTRVPAGKPALFIAAVMLGLAYFLMLRTRSRVSRPGIPW